MSDTLQTHGLQHTSFHLWYMSREDLEKLRLWDKDSTVVDSLFFFQFVYYPSLFIYNSSKCLLSISCVFSIFPSILFQRCWIIFTVIILNSFSGRLPISSSFSCFSGVLPYSFIWDIIFCLLILFNFLLLWFLFWNLQDCSSWFFCLTFSGWNYLRGLCKLLDERNCLFAF